MSPLPATKPLRRYHPALKETMKPISRSRCLVRSIALAAIPRTLLNTAAGTLLIITQFIPGVNGQGSLTSPSKPVIVQTLAVLSWSNGYSEVDGNGPFDRTVSTIDFGIVPTHLKIDATDATYSFTVSRTAVAQSDLPRLQVAQVANTAGFDVQWPTALPSLSGPAAYVTIADPLHPLTIDSKHSLDVLHQYYLTHRDQLRADAQARAAAAASATPSPTPPFVTFKRIETPAPSPH